MKKQLVDEETKRFHENINEFDILSETKTEETKKHKSKEANGKMVRFGVYITEEQLEQIKILAAKEHKKIKGIVEEAISLYLQGK